MMMMIIDDGFLLRLWFDRDKSSSNALSSE